MQETSQNVESSISVLFSSVNVPWPEHGMGDAEYIYAFQKVIMPIAMEFAPELVISEFKSYRKVIPPS